MKKEEKIICDFIYDFVVVSTSALEIKLDKPQLRLAKKEWKLL